MVLLKTQVMTMAKAMAMTMNLSISRKPLPPVDLAQAGTRNSGRCQSAHRSPRMRVPSKGPCSGCSLGSASRASPVPPTAVLR